MSGLRYEKMHQRAVVSTLPGLLRTQLKQCFALVIAAGFASAAGKSLDSQWGTEKRGRSGVIAVLPEFEGRGIGSKLLKLVESWLWGDAMERDMAVDFS